MVFQSTVALTQGFGVPGEQFTDSPWRAESFTLRSASSDLNIIGATAYTITSQGVAEAGSAGTKGFAGILADPKVYSLTGPIGGAPLAPSLTLLNETQAELVTMGTFIVTLPAAAAIGDYVTYDNTTGAIGTQAPGAITSGKTFANAIVDYYTVSGAGLAVITMSPASHVLT